MTAFVLDYSIALCWCFQDEATPETFKLLDQVGREGASVPNLFHLETANALLTAERRGRIKPFDTTAQLALLGSLPLEVDSETSSNAPHATLTLARIHRLSSYDAAYLELAQRLNLPLATHDKALLVAARIEGVRTLP